MFTFSFHRHDHSEHERREIGNFQGYNSPDAPQYFQGGNYGAREHYRDAAAQSAAKQVWMMRNYVLNTPNSTPQQIIQPLTYQQQIYQKSAWNRLGAQYVTGVHPPVGPLYAQPMSPALMQQRMQMYAQQYTQEYNYVPYHVSGRLPHDMHMNVNVSGLSPYGPEMTVPLDMPRFVPRMRNDGTYTANPNDGFGAPARVDRGTPWVPGATGYSAGPTIAWGNGGRGVAQTGGYRGSGGEASNKGRQEAGRKGEGASVKGEMEAKFSARQKEAKNIQEEIKALNAQRLKRQNEMTESVKKQQDAFNRSVEAQGTLKKQTNEYQAAYKLLEVQEKGARERQRIASELGAAGEEEFKKASAERAEIQARMQKLQSNFIANTLPGLQKVSLEREEIFTEMTKQGAAIAKEMVEVGERIDRLQKRFEQLQKGS